MEARLTVLADDLEKGVFSRSFFMRSRLYSGPSKLASSLLYWLRRLCDIDFSAFSSVAWWARSSTPVA